MPGDWEDAGAVVAKVGVAFAARTWDWELWAETAGAEAAEARTEVTAAGAEDEEAAIDETT